MTRKTEPLTEFDMMMLRSGWTLPRDLEAQVQNARAADLHCAFCAFAAGKLHGLAGWFETRAARATPV